MNSVDIQKTMESYHYWDMWVTRLECRYFADEVELAHEDNYGYEIVYMFSECYKVDFDHVKDYDKLRPVKDMTRPQMPYSMQDVEVSTQTESGITFYVCKINMFPLYLEIWCKDISVAKQACYAEK